MHPFEQMPHKISLFFLRITKWGKVGRTIGLFNTCRGRIHFSLETSELCNSFNYLCKSLIWLWLYLSALIY